jgi:V/A-type H+-transporting ATPase subunit E
VALSDILTKILEEAEGQAREIKARGEEEAGKVLDEARAEARILREEIIRKGVEELRGARDSELSAARIRTRKDVLARKKELLNELFAKVPAILHQRSAGDYARALCCFVEEEAALLPGVLETGSEDVGRFGGGFPGLVVEALEGRYPACRLTASREPGPFRQGIVIRTEQLAWNLSLDSLLAGLRGRLESDVANLLFAP